MPSRPPDLCNPSVRESLLQRARYILGLRTLASVLYFVYPGALITQLTALQRICTDQKTTIRNADLATIDSLRKKLFARAARACCSASRLISAGTHMAFVTLRRPQLESEEEPVHPVDLKDGGLLFLTILIMALLCPSAAQPSLCRLLPTECSNEQ
jgi:hypothetical protein